MDEFEVCGHCSKGSSTTMPRCPYCTVKKSSVAKGQPQREPMPADRTTAMASLEVGLEKFCKEQRIEKSIWTDGLNRFAETNEGAALKRAVYEAQPAETKPTVAPPRNDAMAALEQGLSKFCQANNITKSIWTAGLARFVETTEGAALKAAVDNPT